MAIDPKELRIGSHVNANGVRAKVIDIHNKLLRPDCKYQIFVEGISPEDGEKKVVGSIADDLQPIPIAPELLTELGFKYNEYNNGKLWELDFPDLYKAYMYLEFDEDATHRYNFRMWNMKEVEVYGAVEYLHELENWIYLIYGKELTID